MIESCNRPNRQSPAQTIWWWLVTLLTLAVLDDLTFGPFFWTLAQVAGSGWATATVFAVYVPAQVFCVVRGTNDDPGAVAGWFLRRLDLQRRYSEVGERESLLRSRITGGASAVALSLLVGGIIPPLVLWRQGYERRFVLCLSVVTSAVYATEFALLHGAIPAQL